MVSLGGGRRSRRGEARRHWPDLRAVRSPPASTTLSPTSIVKRSKGGPRPQIANHPGRAEARPGEPKLSDSRGAIPITSGSDSSVRKGPRKASDSDRSLTPPRADCREPNLFRLPPARKVMKRTARWIASQCIGRSAEGRFEPDDRSSHRGSSRSDEEVVIDPAAQMALALGRAGDIFPRCVDARAQHDPEESRTGSDYPAPYSAKGRRNCSDQRSR